MGFLRVDKGCKGDQKAREGGEEIIQEGLRRRTV